MANPTDFGTWLRVERQARGWTQREMATVVGIAVNTIARWERGEIIPTPLTQTGVRAALAEHDRREEKR